MAETHPSDSGRQPQNDETQLQHLMESSGCHDDDDHDDDDDDDDGDDDDG